jgi:hypothetical protein
MIHTNTISIGVPVNVSQDERDAMKITEIVTRAHIMDAEKDRKLARVRTDAQDEEFKRVYAMVIADIKRTDTAHVKTRCFIKHLSETVIKEKLRNQFKSDGLPKPVFIHVENNDRGDVCMCFWTSVFGCCLPLGYWAFHCVRNHYKGDSHTIGIQF